jgi:hypothetical protein
MAEPSLELLQTMVQRVLDVLGQHGERLGSIEGRLTALEKHMAGLHHVVASGVEDTANSQRQVGWKLVLGARAPGSAVRSKATFRFRARQALACRLGQKARSGEPFCRRCGVNPVQ